MEACVWLEQYLKSWNTKGILVMVSHSQDFMNEICTNIVSIQDRRLHYYTGNYDQYVQTRNEKEENQMRTYKTEQDQMKHMKDYIARFGHGSAKLARQAKSREKALARMEVCFSSSFLLQVLFVLFCFSDQKKKKKKEYFSSDPEADKIRALFSQIDDITLIMHENMGRSSFSSSSSFFFFLISFSHLLAVWCDVGCRCVSLCLSIDIDSVTC